MLYMKDEQCGKALGDMRTPQSAESIWQGDLYQTIFKWGWFEAFYDTDFSCDFRDQLGGGVVSNNKIQTALQALGLSYLPSGKGGDNECISVEHYDETLLYEDEEDEEEDEDMDIIQIREQTYTVDNVVYPATGAYYRFALNREGGAIFAQSLLKPQAAAKEFLEPDIPEDQMPQLQRASDIIWSYWERNNPRPQDLKYYFVNYIREEVTQSLMARALRNHNMDEVPYWPGLELEMHSIEAEAILGSPIGSGLAHLLLQHKKTLGVKKLSSVTIFRDNWDKQPALQLLFKIIDVPLDELYWDSDTEMTDALDAKAKRMVPSSKVVMNSGKNIVREHKMVLGL